MSTRYLPTGTLVQEQLFRRLLLWSLGAHLVAMGVSLIAPTVRRAPIISVPVFVDLVAAPKPAAAPPKRTRQVVDEPVVIPRKPKPLPKPKPKAEPKPAPKEEPKPPPKAEPKEPPPSAEELLARLRENVEARTAATPSQTQAATGAPGRFDPQMAAYQRKLKALLYSNWAGAQAFRGRDDLVASFKVQLDPGGGVREVSLVGSSGDRYFDESAERAIWKTRPFPRPPRGALVLTLAFDPKGSR